MIKASNRQKNEWIVFVRKIWEKKLRTKQHNEKKNWYVGNDNDKRLKLTNITCNVCICFCAMAANVRKRPTFLSNTHALFFFPLLWKELNEKILVFYCINKCKRLCPTKNHASDLRMRTGYRKYVIWTQHNVEKNKKKKCFMRWFFKMKLL